MKKVFVFCIGGTGIRVMKSIMMVRPYRRYNKYSIGKLLGKCSNIYLSSPAYLPTKGRQGV